jgi:outer membrane lipoprotein-sorting protein
MKKWYIIIGAFCCMLSAPCFASTNDDTALLKKVDSLASYLDCDYSAKYTITQSKPGQKPSTTVAAVFRRDKEELYTIVITDPPESRGQGYLKQGKMLWFYDPSSKVWNSTTSRDRFQNTNASNSDFTRSTLADDYNVIQGSSVKLGRYHCRMLSLVAKNSDVAYPRMKVWVDELGLVRKAEDYSLSGQLLRTLVFPDYFKMGARYVPRTMLIVDALRGATIDGKFQNEKTLITITQPSFEIVDSVVFTKPWLENINQGRH